MGGLSLRMLGFCRGCDKRAPAVCAALAPPFCLVHHSVIFLVCTSIRVLYVGSSLLFFLGLQFDVQGFEQAIYEYC